MVKHIILWKLKKEFSAEEKEKIKSEAKENLEALKGVVPGLIDITLNIGRLDSSNADMMLDSSFESEDALKGYAVHPAHVSAADGFVRPFAAERLCLDFEV